MHEGRTGPDGFAERPHVADTAVCLGISSAVSLCSESACTRSLAVSQNVPRSWPQLPPGVTRGAARRGHLPLAGSTRRLLVSTLRPEPLALGTLRAQRVTGTQAQRHCDRPCSPQWQLSDRQAAASAAWRLGTNGRVTPHAGGSGTVRGSMTLLSKACLLRVGTFFQNLPLTIFRSRLTSGHWNCRSGDTAAV